MMNDIEDDQSHPDTCDTCHGSDDVADYTLTEFGGVISRRLCADCAHDSLATCGDCQAVIWADEGIRIYGTSTLFCESCAAQHPKVILGRELDARLDEARGK